MNSEKFPPIKVIAARFAKAVGVLFSSGDAWEATRLSTGLFALLLTANGLTVVNSFVGRNFMTAIAGRDNGEFVRQAAIYVCVFLASTVVAVVARFAEERLGIVWRATLTRRFLKLYFANGAYWQLAVSGDIVNPDQRVAEDVRGFATSTLSFLLMAFNSSVTIVAFAGVMLSISPLLSVAAVLYAALGSGATLWLGHPLIKLNSSQLDKEASFRTALTRVKENAEAILVAHEENAQSTDLLGHLNELIANARSITSVNRRVGFFTTGYNWMIQIIPALIMAPAYFIGRVEFGVVTQSIGAFATSVAAFSLVVTQFQSLSALAAVIERLNALEDAVERARFATLSIETLGTTARLLARADETMKDPGRTFPPPPEHAPAVLPKTAVQRPDASETYQIVA
jgi:putative ATP-binding cassette transporter